MTLFNLAIMIILVGLSLWAVNKFIPMNQTVKNILNIVVIGCLLIWILNLLGVFSSLSDVKVPRIK